MQAVSSHSNLASFAGKNNTGNARGAGAKYDGSKVRAQAGQAKKSSAPASQPKFGYIPIATELAACCACCCALPILAPVALGVKKGVGGIGSKISGLFNRGDKAEEAVAT